MDFDCKFHLAKLGAAIFRNTSVAVKGLRTSEGFIELRCSYSKKTCNGTKNNIKNIETEQKLSGLLKKCLKSQILDSI